MDISFTCSVLLRLCPRYSFSLADWLRAQKKSLIRSRKSVSSLILFVGEQSAYDVHCQFAYMLTSTSVGSQEDKFGQERRAEVSLSKWQKNTAMRCECKMLSVNANTPPNIRLFKT